MLKKILAIALFLIAVPSFAQYSQVGTARRVIKRSSAPAACATGDIYYNTTSNILAVCTSANTWSTVTTVTSGDTRYLKLDGTNAMGSTASIGWSTDAFLSRDAAGRLQIGSTAGAEDGQLIANGGINVNVGNSAGVDIAYNRVGVSIGSTGKYHFTSGAVTASADVCAERSAAGLIKISDCSTGWGGVHVGGNTDPFSVRYTDGQRIFEINAGGGLLMLYDGGHLNWSSTNQATGGKDTGIKRHAAGILAVTNGTTGGGAVDLGDPGAKPACSSTYRGTIWIEEGGAGVADTVEVCSKDAADAYAWRALY